MPEANKRRVITLAAARNKDCGGTILEAGDIQGNIIQAVM